MYLEQNSSQTVKKITQITIPFTSIQISLGYNKQKQANQNNYALVLQMKSKIPKQKNKCFTLTTLGLLVENKNQRLSMGHIYRKQTLQKI